MPIDPSIALQARLPQLESPIDVQAKVQQLKGMQNQNRLADLMFAGKERELQQENALSQAYKSALGGDGAIDRSKLYSELAQGGLGAKLPGVQKSFADQDKAAREAERAQLQTAAEKAELVGRYMTAAKQNPTMYPQILAALRQEIPGGGKELPDQFDQNIVDATIQRAMGVKDQVAQVWKQKEYDLDISKFGYQQQNDATNRAVTMRGQNMTDARGRDLAEATRSAGGKPPAGYRFKPDGNLEAIPGGPADIKAGELGAKRERQQQGALDQADRIIAKVDQSLEKVGLNTAGFGGSAMSMIPGSESRDLKSDLETIKANLGFAELQAMRDASPTGGALGQVAVQELVALQSTVASLDQAQSPQQLRQRLSEIKKHYGNWKSAVQGAEKAAPKDSQGPNIDALLKKYGG